jgi:myo-inositol-1(or 4)-monophosphatase
VAPDESPAEGLLSLAERLARETGDLILAGRSKGIVDVDTKSTGTDMVTEFDRAAETLIVSELRRLRPDDAIVGEEGTDRRGTSGIAWLIDPIDGTTNFLYGLPGYAVSIAASDGDGPLVGAVAVPTFGEVFTARRGGGAWCNGEPLWCSNQTVLGEALVATGFSYAAERRGRQADVLRQVLPRVRDIRRFGAAAVDLCFVGAGRVDAYFEKGMAAWDSAAGGLVATEAGALLGGLDGGPPRPDALLAAAPGVFEALQALLIEAGAADA